MSEVMEKTTVSKPAVTKQKKVRVPLLMRMIRWTFPKVEALAPGYAHAWFVRLFFTPLRYSIPDHEMEMIRKAARFTVTAGEHKIECYSWGEGPVVLFVHGWAGRASQFRNFVQRFTEAGYRAVAFDAPAHGLSKGSQTSIVDFKDSILALEKSIGDIQAVVAHSLGGTAGLYALTEGLNVNTVITIATPTIGDEIMSEFSSRLNSSPRAATYLKEFVTKKFGRPFDALMASHFVRHIPREIDLLILHDDQDKEASLRNARKLMEAYPKATFIKTTGLGHVRILRDVRVIEDCLAFIQGRIG